MSILVTQQSNRLNLASSDMLFEVTSSFINQPQYQYIAALVDSGSQILTTVKQQPNPSGFGVFNLGRIVPQYLSYDYDHFTMGADSLFWKNQNQAKIFKVRFGEEYSTSVTGSVFIYNGIVNNITGSPAQTGSTNFYYFLNGILDPNSGDWNWNTTRFYDPQATPSSATFFKQVALTDAPRQQNARIGDYLTIACLNGSLTSNVTSSQDIYSVDYNVYYDGNLVFTSTEFNVNNTLNQINYGGPRTSSLQTWSQVNQLQTQSFNIGSQTARTLLMNIGIGPGNLSLMGNYNFDIQPWDYYEVYLRPQQSSNTPNLNAYWDKFTIVKQDKVCGYEGVRFAWVNDYGSWDWFNFQLQNDKQTILGKNKYTSNFVQYNTPTTQVNYDKKRRGQSYYDINLDETYNVFSDWLSQEEADWLESLFYSPNVYIQQGLEMLPVIVTNVEFTSKTNPRSQKLFQYTVQYSLANSKRSR